MPNVDSEPMSNTLCREVSHEKIDIIVAAAANFRAALNSALEIHTRAHKGPPGGHIFFLSNTLRVQPS